MTMPWSPGQPARPVSVVETAIPGETGGELTLTCRVPGNCGARGVVIFCHGLGSSGRAYGAMTDPWAEQGYLVIHPTFADSIFTVAAARPELGLDPEDPDLVLWARARPALRPVMHGILHDPEHWLDRVAIVRQVMKHLPTLLSATGNAGASLPVAIAGHSFGAYTAQLFAGAEIDLPDGPRSFRDDRFAAALVLSGQGRDQQGLREGSWDGMTGPVLTVTGKRDGGAKGQDWRWKCEPFDLAPAGGKVLTVLDDATHYLGGMIPEGDTVPYQLEALSLVTTAFLDAHVGGSAQAQTWLEDVTTAIADCPVVFRRK